jgi:hypothetical protein
MARKLFIVDRGNERLFAALRGALANEPDVEILYDRRVSISRARRWGGDERRVADDVRDRIRTEGLPGSTTTAGAQCPLGVIGCANLHESAVYAYRSTWTAPQHVPLESAVTFVMPFFFGTGPERSDVWPTMVTAVFVGSVPTVALACGVRHALKEPVGRFFVGLLVVAGGIHYGGPVVRALAGAPGCRSGRTPG